MGMEIAIAPSGRLRLEGAENIFAEGNGAGLFRLLADPLPPDAGASYSFFRRLARDYAMRLCRSATGEGSDPFAAALPDRELIEAELFDRPPLTGGEYLNGELLERFHAQPVQGVIGPVLICHKSTSFLKFFCCFPVFRGKPNLRNAFLHSRCRVS